MQLGSVKMSQKEEIWENERNFLKCFDQFLKAKFKDVVLSK